MPMLENANQKKKTSRKFGTFGYGERKFKWKHAAADQQSKLILKEKQRPILDKGKSLYGNIAAYRLHTQ